MQLWDRATQSPADVALPPGSVGLAGFRPDGTLVVDQPSSAVVFWDLETGRPIRTVQLEEPPGPSARRSLTSDGTPARRRGAARPCLRVGRHHRRAGRRPRGPAGHGARHRDQPHAGGDTSRSDRPDGGISLYDLTTERVIGEPIYGHGAGIRDLAYSASGEYLVSVADDGLIGLWGSSAAPGLDQPSRRAGREEPVALGRRISDARLPQRPGTPRGPLGRRSHRTRHPDHHARSGHVGELSDDGSLVLAGNGSTAHAVGQRCPDRRAALDEHR